MEFLNCICPEWLLGKNGRARSETWFFHPKIKYKNFHLRLYLQIILKNMARHEVFRGLLGLNKITENFLNHWKFFWTLYIHGRLVHIEICEKWLHGKSLSYVAPCEWRRFMFQLPEWYQCNLTIETDQQIATIVIWPPTSFEKWTFDTAVVP